MNYKIKSFWGFRKRILYQCLSCNTDLESPFKDAGNTDTCPICQATFIVPAGEKKLRLAAEKEQKRVLAEKI
jgi:DNA-directed RNA polymerase subunit RPC12/RpoP